MLVDDCHWFIITMIHVSVSYFLVVKQFTCELCGISYCHREGLSRHLQTAHSDNWPHKCEVCGMGYENI